MRRRVRIGVPRPNFRAKAHAWFARAPHRLALARLHGQMAVLCRAEADAIARPYDVVRQPLTPDEREEIAHLDALGNEAADRMDRLAPGRCSGGFYAFIFDYPGGPS